MKTNTRAIGVRVSDWEYSAIENEVNKGKAINASDFLRQALREKLMKAEA